MGDTIRRLGLFYSNWIRDAMVARLTLDQKVSCCFIIYSGHVWPQRNIISASYFMIQEGIYRRSLEMLKAPSLN